MGVGKKFPGKPRKCDNEPGSKACVKASRNGGSLCKGCPYAPK